ncbi:acid protease [Irpex rosettiformis]|uniref:Acid protease n=1 Tax=Irpex rosettiformis TaxID=378272 RepID=A0ACB8TXY4_9APHY|nr:acid protease [Irpex rosettiformis]
MLAYPILLLLAVVGTGGTSTKSSPHASRNADSGVLGLSIDAEINLSRLSNVVAADIARAAHFKSHGQGKKRESRHRGKRQSVAISATNSAVSFTSRVKFGDPATEYTLLIDSGSSNTFVGLKKEYSATNSSHATGKTVSVTYGSGKFSGPEYTDRVDLGNNLVITTQRIAGVNHSSGFDGSFDGILGIGPTDLTQGTVSGSSEEIPTILDNLFAQKTIGAKVIGMSLPPFPSNTPGSITFGGADSSKYKGELAYTNLTKTDPAKDYWGIDQSIRYGDSTILKLTSGIVDSGSTMILLAPDAFNAYKQATGATLDDKTKLLKLPKDQYSKLQPLKFTIGGVDYTLNADAQLFPCSLNKALGGDNDSIYLVVNNLGENSVDGLSFINGYSFMERFYTVYDAANSKIGLATTEYTDSEGNCKA